MRGVRQTWPAAIVGGLVFALAQFATSNSISAELTGIVAALLATGERRAAAGLAAQGPDPWRALRPRRGDSGRRRRRCRARAGGAAQGRRAPGHPRGDPRRLRPYL